MSGERTGPRALVIGAHGDDEVLGCGATIRKLVEAGGRADALIVTEERAGWQAASREIGYGSVRFLGRPTMRLDQENGALLADDLLQAIAGEGPPPDLVLTHSRHDMNADHVAVHDAVRVACRPCNMHVRAWGFAIPGSSEWAGDMRGPFMPSVFVQVRPEHVDAKVRAMTLGYADELRDASHPRSKDGIRDSARQIGRLAGWPCGEAFEHLFDYSGTGLAAT